MESTFDDEKLFSYTDSYLYNHITSIPTPPLAGRAVPLSEKYFAKGYALREDLEDAVSAMKFASQLGIQVPHVHRINRGDGFYCIMDRVPGTTLEIAWHGLGWIASLRIAFELRRIVHRLRSAVSTSAGTLPRGRCTSFFLDDKYGLPARANFQCVNAFLNFWVNFAAFRRELSKTPAEHAICPRPVFSYDRPFVFTHHDLAPRNIMLDKEGQIRIIDWDDAGFYPEFFEYAAMHNFPPADWTRFALWRWKLCAWIAGGLYSKERSWLAIIQSRFTRFRAFRRFNMMAGGYAAVANRPARDINSDPNEQSQEMKDKLSMYLQLRGVLMPLSRPALSADSASW
ncbi:hypothetical protein E4U56_008251 [Claviceps arundinis]|uniref:Aminoglycoside phosphotransferase domain-containing protein n=1 Tax=Claviceps arundinis TaxID=1623583 RepID=A0A9P7MSU2_9HYPO|nr:hypothetical protein E4U56_008251 [Claviceps arundinis]